MARQQKQDKPQMQSYRLMQGKHASGRKTDPDNPRRVYVENEIITTTKDLLELNGRPPMSPKFVLVGSPQDVETHAPPGVVSIEANDALDDMSENDLRRFAADEEIDLSGCSNKQQIINAIRTAHV